jgi:Flp pilus assembly protein TadB
VISALLVGWGVLLGLDPRRAAALLLVIVAPVPVAGLLAVLAWRARPEISTRAALFCEAVAGELRSGASMRFALERAAASVGAPIIEEMSRAGAPLAEIGHRAELEFAEIGLELGAVIQRVSRLGSPAAPLFDELGVLALAQVEVAHEIATATAPARATAVVLLLVPVAAIASVTITGRLGGYLSTTAQRLSALIGLSLVMAGIGWALAILRRAR